MSNQENLIPLKKGEKRTKEICRKGAYATHKAIRQKKFMSEMLITILNAKSNDEEAIQYLKAAGISGEVTEAAVMTLGIIKTASTNPSAYKEIMDRTEGRVIEEKVVNGNLSLGVEALLEELDD